MINSLIFKYNKSYNQNIKKGEIHKAPPLPMKNQVMVQNKD